MAHAGEITGKRTEIADAASRIIGTKGITAEGTGFKPPDVGHALATLLALLTPVPKRGDNPCHS